MANLDITETRRNLRNLQGMIYKTSKGYYWMGLGLFQECSEEEKNLYEKYRIELNKIHNLTYQPNKCDVKGLVEILSEISKLGEEYHDEKNYLEVNRKQSIFTENLSDAEINEIQNQIDDLMEALDYKDGAFYRHTKKAN